MERREPPLQDVLESSRQEEQHHEVAVGQPPSQITTVCFDLPCCIDYIGAWVSRPMIFVLLSLLFFTKLHPRLAILRY